MAIISFKVASASEYLAITGWGINDIRLAKKAWVFIGQSCARFDVSPVNYTFQVEAMSSEKLPFILPAVFTIGPQTDDVESLIRYARLIAPCDKNSDHVKDLVQGVIEGETRVLAASMTMEDIFKGTKTFKQEVFGKVQLELNQFGLVIYNANVKQLVDVKNHEYFSYLGQKTQQEAANQAKVDVAEARMKGEMGSKERDGRTRQNAAKIDAETKAYSKQREGEGSKAEAKVQTEVMLFQVEQEAAVAAANAQLSVKKAEWLCQAKVADVEAAKAIAIRDSELQLEVEKKNASCQTEKLKAELLSRATVNYEIKVQEANWELYRKQKVAEAALYEQERQAEGQRAIAEANFFTLQQQADGALYAKQKEAEGILSIAEAQGVYLRTILEALGGDYAAMRDFLMIDGGTYKEMARINAEAVKGLNPKISIWSNGSEVAGGGGQGSSHVSSAMRDMAGVYSMLPPLFGTVQEQTGMLPPPWMGKLESPAN
ncbi:flotillin-like protein 1 [Zingiber officinale]|uniref:Flotillin-like n=1 Tax=Zingiber officinale TaxID=94328 RepID=A0A8J5F5P2_ZINOF|nr:flotillin-like protein 1 [Zingiber officinale]KAG6479192.1 hypothetical protein ZIOFF_062653 [Zingiber officinale]